MLKSKSVSGSFGTGGKGIQLVPEVFLFVDLTCSNKVINYVNWPKMQQLVGLVV